jgi:hypothetical protein
LLGRPGSALDDILSALHEEHFMDYPITSLQGIVKAALVTLVLCVTLAGAALGAAGRLPPGRVAQTVATAVNVAAGTLTPALNPPRSPRVALERTL